MFVMPFIFFFQIIVVSSYTYQMGKCVKEKCQELDIKLCDFENSIKNK